MLLANECKPRTISSDNVVVNVMKSREGGRVIWKRRWAGYVVFARPKGDDRVQMDDQKSSTFKLPSASLTSSVGGEASLFGCHRAVNAGRVFITAGQALVI